MNERRETAIRVSHLALPLLFLAVAAAPFALAGGSTLAGDLVAWISAGPRVVNDGFRGGDNSPPLYSCLCNQTGSVQCPNWATCGRTYSSCYSNGINTNGCSGTGNCQECGGGANCNTACTGACSGEKSNCS